MSRLDPVYAPWGGNAEAMALDLGVPGITARKWRTRENIPTKYWPSIIAAAARRESELTLEQIASAHVPVMGTQGEAA